MLIVVIILILPYSELSGSSRVNLDYWYSNQTNPRIIGFVLSPVIYRQNYNAAFDFWGTTWDAILEWHSVEGIHLNSFTGIKSNASTEMYAGTRHRLQLEGFNVGQNDAGLFIPVDIEFHAYYSYNGNTVHVFRYIKTKLCIVDRGASYAQNRTTATHELGHALGWRGHMPWPYSWHVMYGTVHSSYSLKTREINHIKQIYNVIP